jgi:ABC-type maltose transport system permease subunit
LCFRGRSPDRPRKPVAAYLSAASLIVVGPIVALYLIFQRNFVSGITQGVVKG